ncbi:MAG TPA: GNAT family N-acetyltransferase [Longimicrobium sp.]|jgi:aminoglycoside 6'-N-acetyltransferase I
MSLPDGIRIEPLRPDDEDALHQAAEMLVEGFRDDWPEAWPDLESALAEARSCTVGDRSAWVAREEDGRVAGWIGGIRTYDGNVWELHPMVVRSDLRGRGIGRALVEELAVRAREQGAFTLWLGTDDENDGTTLGGAHLYPGLLDRLREIRNLRNHPFTFYQRVGFELAGVVPDANGPGKPDILMAMSLLERP